MMGEIRLQRKREGMRKRGWGNNKMKIKGGSLCGPNALWRKVGCFSKTMFTVWYTAYMLSSFL